MDIWDVIIVGGGPAGLNAAVVLGRCRRSVLLYDSGTYRNRWSHGMHNYLTQDAILPGEFISICHNEIEKYGVRRITKSVVKARQNKEKLFEVEDENGNIHQSKKLLIATGLKDNIPEIEGFKEMYGKSVFHCPYCDGWEVRNKKLGVYARNKNGAELALSLKGWSPFVKLYTDEKGKLKSDQKKQLEENEIPIIKSAIAKLEGEEGQLKKIIFKNGEEEECDAIFFVNGYTQQCDLVEVFDCEISKKGVVVTNRFQQTSTHGLFVAGDADKDVQFVVVAAAEGAKAGVIINKQLQKELNKK
jgi:thioredoxin reductase